MINLSCHVQSLWFIEVATIFTVIGYYTLITKWHIQYAVNGYRIAEWMMKLIYWSACTDVRLLTDNYYNYSLAKEYQTTKWLVHEWKI